MSFDLAVLATHGPVSVGVAQQIYQRCNGQAHTDGHLDHRIAVFYEELRLRYPDHPPYPAESPWMSMPLDIGIDHVIVHITWSPRGTTAVEAVMELARRHRLVVFDPQSDDVYLPTS